MKVVLLSGGSGKRLWPLSNDARSKQFLKVLNGENNQLESMVQRMWRQLQSAGLSESTIIATSASQVDMIQGQIGADVPLILEPERRDTFPAIALAASYLYSVEHSSPDEVIAILPVDPFVDAGFFDKVKELEMTVRANKANIALIGVEPAFPSTKYGYIVPDEEKTDPSYQAVNCFIEKPSESKAAQLIGQGALWNCGVFALKIGYLLNILDDLGLPKDYYQLKKCYQEIPKNSFDYEVVEKELNRIVIQYGGHWKDLGTWNTLTEEMAHTHFGKGIICNKSVNTHLINELDIPVTVLGVPNAIIAVSSDGILVADKEESPKIKEIVTHYNQRPMFEERRWGWYRVLDHSTFSDRNEVLTKRIRINAGKNLSYQKHAYRRETWTIIHGEGRFIINDRMMNVGAGDVLQIGKGDKHALKATTDIELIEVQSGTHLTEEDIVRIFMTWDEIEEHCETMEKVVFS